MFSDAQAKMTKQKNESPKGGAANKDEIKLILLPYQPSYRYTKRIDNQMQWHQLVTYSLGMQWREHQIFIDYDNDVDDSGNQTLIFRKEQSELLLNYRYLVYSLNQFLNLGLGFGLGAYEISLKSRLLNQESTDRSGNQILTSGVVSLSGAWSYLFYGLELQALVGRDYDPQPTFAVQARLGFQFVIF